MAWPPSATRASPSTSPTAISKPRAAASSWPTRPATSNTPATWSPARRTRTSAIVLIDARKGVLDQTRRHAAIASLLGIRDVVLAVNKMDLVGFDQAVFERIVADFHAVLGHLHALAVTAIPVCARDGDNVTTPSTRMPWYQGTSLLAALESAEPGHDGARAAVPHAGAAGQPPGPDVPRLCRHHRRRHAAPGRHGGERRLAHRGAGRPHRHHGRRPGRGARRRAGDAGAGPRDRRLARRRAGRRAAAGSWPSRSMRAWCGWTTRRCSAAAPIR